MKKIAYFIITIILLSHFIIFNNPSGQIYFHKLENSMLDFKIKFFNNKKNINPNIVIISINDASVERFGRWPFSREIIAKALTHLYERGVKIVALDMIFDKPQEATLRTEKASLLELLHMTYKNEISDPQTWEQIIDTLAENSSVDMKLVKSIEKFNGNIQAFYINNHKEVMNFDILKNKASCHGFINTISDIDGIVRKFPLQYENKYLSFASCIFQEMQKHNIISTPNTIKTYQRHAEPIHGYFYLTLNPYGKAQTFPYITFDAAFDNNLPLKLPPVALVGLTGTGLGDIRPSSLDAYMPGIELHATAVQNLIDNRYIKTLSPLVETIFLATFLAIFVLLKDIHTPLRNGIYGVTALCFIIIDLSAFYLYNIHVHSLTFYIGITLILFSMLISDFLETQIEKKKMHSALSCYLSQEIVNEIIKNPSLLQLQNERKFLTIMFSDLRGFTDMSEKIPPQELANIVNAYLSPMTLLIKEEKGFVNKYIGDAIMAWWGAPVDLPYAADYALRCAYRMQQNLKNINAHLQKQYPNITLNVGIGIHSGYVALGNFGSSDRFEYSIIGNDVNLASRLEGLNKYYKTTILFSQQTLEKLAQKEHFLFRELDTVLVKGASQPLIIYELLAYRPNLSEPWPHELMIRAQQFAQALEAYYKGDWQQALKLFENFAYTYADNPAFVFIERLKTANTTPPENWQGVWKFTSK